MVTEIESGWLWEALKNASLFCREKTWNGGECRLRATGDGWLEVSASDDFVGVVTQVPFDPEEKWDRFITARQLRGGRDISGLEKRVGESVEGYISLDELLTDATTEPTEPEWWKQFDQILRDATKEPIKTLEVNPARLTMLSRLEPKGEFCLSITGASYEDENLWLFAYGPDTMGVIVPLNREDLKDFESWLL